jgi:hypothetical protein
MCRKSASRLTFELIRIRSKLTTNESNVGVLDISSGKIAPLKFTSDQIRIKSQGHGFIATHFLMP